MPTNQTYRRKLHPALKRTLEAAGGTLCLSRLVGVTPQAVSQWRRVPIQHVPQLSRILSIPRYQLRPDIYEEPDARSA